MTSIQQMDITGGGQLTPWPPGAVHHFCFCRHFSSENDADSAEHPLEWYLGEVNVMPIQDTTCSIRLDYSKICSIQLDNLRLKSYNAHLLLMRV